MSMCKKMLTFSYDDGIYQDERLVEIFNKYGMKATFNLNTGIQSPESNFEIEGIKIARMEQEGLAKLYEGHEIAYGDVPDPVVSYLKDIGIRYGRTVESTHSFTLPQDPLRLNATCHHNDDKLFELAEQFLAAKPEEPMLFYVWGHSYEFDVNNNWERIEEFCKMLGGRDDIFYGTNAQCLGYI